MIGIRGINMGLNGVMAFLLCIFSPGGPGGRAARGAREKTVRQTTRVAHLAVI